jgi:hypothetical protein
VGPSGSALSWRLSPDWEQTAGAATDQLPVLLLPLLVLVLVVRLESDCCGQLAGLPPPLLLLPV